MKTRRFGRTGLQVSELVFGGGFVGGLLITQDDATKEKAIQTALHAGINWIDTAPSYGNGQSEETLGWLLADRLNPPYVSTKFNLDSERLDDIAGQIEASLEASLKRLRRDSVDLLQLHNRITPTTSGRDLSVETILGSGGIADCLDRLREQGLFRYQGITALGDGKSCCEVIASDRFDSAQVYYNLLNPSAGHAVPPGWSGHDFGDVMECCWQHDVAVMNIRVFAAGVLATDVRHGREIPVTQGSDVKAEEYRTKKVFEILGDKYGTRAQTAIRYALANPMNACVIFGLAELSHLNEALAAAAAGPLPQSALDELQELYRTDFGQLK